MNTYRIQARSLGKYLVDTIKADSSDDALDKFSKKVNEGIFYETKGSFLD